MYRFVSKSRLPDGPSSTSARLVLVAMTVVLLAFAAQAPQAVLAQTAVPAHAATSAASAASPSTVGGEALAQCERAVRQALLPQSATAANVRFSATPPLPRASADGSQIVLQGEGQWREAAVLRKFNYRCNIDPHSGQAVGVVIRQAAPPLAAQDEPMPIQDPDLSHLSPSAGESGAAVALQRRWPRVSQITFDAETRSLTQQSASRAELHGQGRARHAPESPALVHFGFDCTIDPRDGRVIGMRLNG